MSLLIGITLLTIANPYGDLNSSKELDHPECLLPSRSSAGFDAIAICLHVLHLLLTTATQQGWTFLSE